MTLELFPIEDFAVSNLISFGKFVYTVPCHPLDGDTSARIQQSTAHSLPRVEYPVSRWRAWYARISMRNPGFPRESIDVWTTYCCMAKYRVAMRNPDLIIPINNYRGLVYHRNLRRYLYRPAAS